MERHEKSRSDREIVYWSLDKDGQVFHEVGLPNGKVIPYDEYVLTPPSEPKITVRTPIHKDSNFIPYVIGGVSTFLLLVISLLVFLHVV